MIYQSKKKRKQIKCTHSHTELSKQEKQKTIRSRLHSLDLKKNMIDMELFYDYFDMFASFLIYAGIFWSWRLG